MKPVSLIDAILDDDLRAVETAIAAGAEAIKAEAESGGRVS